MDENITLKQFEEEYDYDCSVCPFHDDVCPGGWKSGYGGVPIEPPCTGWDKYDDDTTLDEIYNDYERSLRAWERELDEEFRIEQELKEKKEKAAKTRKAMESYCLSERIDIKILNRQIKAEKKFISRIECFASAFNATNEMFKYEDRVQANPELYRNLECFEAELVKAKERYALKRKEFYQKKKNGEIKL